VPAFVIDVRTWKDVREMVDVGGGRMSGLAEKMGDD